MMFDARSKVSSKYFGWSEVALLVGGFFLAHGDHIGATCMEFMTPGVAYGLYAITAMVVGTILNLIQVLLRLFKVSQ